MTDEPALITYMTTQSGPERDAAFLDTYAQRVLDGTAATWEIPSTVAGTISAIAARLKVLHRRLELAERAYDRLNLCPDHRDKATDKCVVCAAETRTRLELFDD